ncbi:ATP-binding cassette sub- D member 4, partial [Entomortierella beljakovae]
SGEQEMVAMTVDSQLMRKSNSAFHARRIQFKESTRLDLKQERLKMKYKPVNTLSPNNGAQAASTTTAAAVPYSGNNSFSVVKEDPNGFRLPAKILFHKDKVQLAWPRPQPIGPGLNNLGNTCFLNSVLQCLTYTAPLANYLLSNQHSGSCKTTNFCMMCLLEKHVGRCFNHSMNEAIAPKVIVGRLRNIGKQFRIGRQEDSHEFARYLIDALQKSCLIGFDSKLDDRIKETTVIHQIFGGYFQSQVKCMKCGHESNTFETYLDVSVDIRGAESVQKAFRDFTKPDILTKSNQYKCDKCKVLVDARKQMTIYEAPKILCIHLKRFTFTGQKINRHVNFDSKLELNSVMSTNKKHPDLTYSLYAVLVHAGGSCHSGHYYCYVKSSNGIWYSMNDSHVSVVSLQTVLSQNAYMLFYTQDKKGTSRPANANGMNGVNKSKANGVPNGMSNGPVQMKRPRVSDDEIGDKVDRSSLMPKEKRIKSQESASSENTQELSKEERLRLKKERKRAKKLEKLKLSKSVSNDYDLATTVSSSTASSSTASSSTVSSSPTSISAPKSIFGVPVANVANGSQPSKNLSPLADLDVISKPAVKPSTPKPSSISIPAKSYSDWKVTEGTIKSPVAEELRQLKLSEQRKKEAGDNDSDEKDSEHVEQDGWTVKPRQVTQAIVVSHNESSISKREKLQALIERESEFKSADVKETILGGVKHMLGSKVSTWEEPSHELTKAREEVLRTLKPKHHRPDAYDVDYDRGKVKKIKKKNTSDNGLGGVGASLKNKFQSEQDIRNISKPKFGKNKNKNKKQLPNALLIPTEDDARDEEGTMRGSVPDHDEFMDDSPSAKQGRFQSVKDKFKTWSPSFLRSSPSSTSTWRTETTTNASSTGFVLPKKKLEYRIDRLFVKRLMRIYKILFNKHSTVTWLFGGLAVLSIFTEVVVYFVGNITPQYYKVLNDKDSSSFKGLLFSSLFTVFLAGFCKCMVFFVGGLLSLEIRRTLTIYLHQIYIRPKLFYRILYMHEEEVDNPDQRITQDVDKISVSMGKMVEDLMITPLLIAFYTWQCFKMTGWIGPACIYGYFVFSTVVGRILINPIVDAVFFKEAAEGYFRFLHVRFRQFAEPITFSRGEYEAKEGADSMLDVLLSTQLDVIHKEIPLKFLQESVSYFGSILSYVIIAIPIFWGVYDDKSNSDLSALISMSAFLSMYLTFQFSKVIKCTSDFSDLAGYTSRLGQFIEALDELNIELENIAIDFPHEEALSHDTSIRLENVSFNTPVGDLVVTDLSFRFEVGTNTMIAGPNGAGKTSILRAMGGLWPVSKGQILLPHGYRKEVIFIPQTPYMTYGTLREQLVYPYKETACNVSDDDILRVLKLARLEFVVDLIDNFDTTYSHDWTKMLSPGEQQKMAFARLFYARPTFAVLDESTCSMDSESEEAMFKQCRELNITCITVCHNASMEKFHQQKIVLAGKGGGWTFVQIQEQDQDNSNNQHDDDLDQDSSVRRRRDSASYNLSLPGDGQFQ